MINKYEAIGGIKISREKRSTRIKPTPVLLRPSKTLHDPACVQTQAAAIGSLRITA
jgi:hypothetical protein